MNQELTKAAQQALEALEEIALAGMSGTGQESAEGMRDWHARQAWKFIGIAARALDPLRAALAQRPAAQEVCAHRWCHFGDQQPRRRCIDCNALEPAPQQATPAQESPEDIEQAVRDAIAKFGLERFARAIAEQQATPEPARLQYFRREIGEGDWERCTFEQYQQAQPSPLWDTKVEGDPATPEPVGVFDEFKGRPVLLKTAPMLKHGELLYTRPAAAPAVPEGWRMDREGDDVIVVQHQVAGIARATSPAISMEGQILFMLCDDILKDHQSLAAAQAKWAGHG